MKLTYQKLGMYSPIQQERILHQIFYYYINPNFEKKDIYDIHGYHVSNCDFDLLLYCYLQRYASDREKNWYKEIKKREQQAEQKKAFVPPVFNPRVVTINVLLDFSEVEQEEFLRDCYQYLLVHNHDKLPSMISLQHGTVSEKNIGLFASLYYERYMSLEQKQQYWTIFHKKYSTNDLADYVRKIILSGIGIADGFSIIEGYSVSVLQEMASMYQSKVGINQKRFDEMITIIERIKHFLVLEEKHHKKKKEEEYCKTLFYAFLNDEGYDTYFSLGKQYEIGEDAVKKYIEKYKKTASSEELSLYYQRVEEMHEKETRHKAEEEIRIMRNIFNRCIDSCFSVAELALIAEEYKIGPSLLENKVVYYFSNYASVEEKKRYRQAREKSVGWFRQQPRKNTKKENQCYTLFYQLKDMSYDQRQAFLTDFFEGRDDTLDFLYRAYAQIDDCPNLNSSQKSDIYQSLKMFHQAWIVGRSNNRKKEYYVKKQQEIMRILPEAITWLQRFVQSDSNSLKEFCMAMKIDRKVMSKYVGIIKENRETLYQSYRKKMTVLQNTRYQMICQQISSVFMALHHKGANFTLLEYFVLCPITFESFLKIAEKEYSAYDLCLFQQFLERNKNQKKITQTFLKMRFVITDSNGYHEITFGEKHMILQYMKEQHLPFWQSLFLAIITEIEKGNIHIFGEESTSSIIDKTQKKFC